jgi:hypothetical protein
MVIYKTTNQITGKWYIGKDANNKNYYLGSGKASHHAIKKYGKEAFTKEILEECSDVAPLYVKKQKNDHTNVACRGKSCKLLNGNRTRFNKETVS